MNSIWMGKNKIGRCRSRKRAAWLLVMSLAEIIPNVRNLPAADKLRLIRILAEDVDAGPDIAPLEHGRTYVLSTPVFEAGAADVLRRELEDAR
jgi:hypothetical protein